MKVIKYGFLLAVLWIVACHPPISVPSSSVSQDEKLPMDSAIVSGTLDNGLTYFIRHNEKPENRVELRLVVNAGSILENEDQQGLAHLVEHMAFNGTANFPKQKLVNYLESIGMKFGADINAYTSFDETVYMLQVPTENETFLDTGFQILHDWAGFVTFDGEEIDKERGVVKEEWRLGRGANARMWEKEAPIILKGSRYAERMPIGKPAVIDTAHHETLRQFYRDWYRPDLMSVIVVGTVNPEAIEAMIRDRFSDLTNPKPERIREVFPVPDHQEPLVAVVTDKEAQYPNVSFLVKQAVHDQRTRSTYEYNLRTRLFSSMLRARLDEYRQKPDPPFLFSYIQISSLVRTKEAFQMGAYVNENGISRGLDVLVREAERVRRFGFTPSEFERAKTKLIRSYEQSLLEKDKTPSRQLASELIRHALVGEAVPGIEFETQLAKDYLNTLDLAEINGLADVLLKNENTVIVVEAPEKEGLDLPTEEGLPAVWDQVMQENLKPYVDQVTDQPLVENPPTGGVIVNEKYWKNVDVTRWTLSNGITVYLKPTTFKNDQILMRAYSPGGHSLVSDQQFLTARHAVGIVQEGGIGSYSPVQLNKKLAGKVVRVSPYISELSEGFNGSASNQDLKTLFQLIWLYSTAPRKDSDAFLSYQSRLSSFLENRSASPEVAFRDTIQMVISGYHFRSRPETVSDISKLNLDQAYEFYRDRFGDMGDFTFVFVGSFELDSIRPLVEKWLGGLPSRERQETWRDVGRYPPDQVVIKAVHKGSEPKSLTQIIYPQQVDWTPENEYVVQSLARMLQIKLREVIRESESGTYGVRVRGSLNRYPHNDGRLSISFGADPQRIDALVEEVQIQLDSVKIFGLPETYLQKVKEIQTREFEVSQKENGFWLNRIVYDTRNDLDFGEILATPERIKALTMDDLRRMLQTLVQEDRWVRVTLYPEEGN